MKNKKLIYVLLPAVLVIWGIIFYRIFNAAGGDDNISSFNDPGIREAQVSSYTDTFSIVADYRDPFMGKLAVENRPKTVVTVQPRITEPKPQSPVKIAWPSIGYSGMIKNQKSALQLALLQVDGKSHTLKAGQSVEGVQLVKIFRDSVEVIFQNEKRTIRK